MYKIETDGKQAEVTTRYGKFIITVNDPTGEVVITEVTRQRIGVFPINKNQVNISCFRQNE